MLQEQEQANIWFGRIADIGEELWMYSRNREYLIDEKYNELISYIQVAHTEYYQ